MEHSMIPATDQELLELVKMVSLRDFGLPFRHYCRYNNRLRTTGGRYLLGSHDLELSLKHALAHGMEELLGTIRHELCHYHLHLQGRGFRHGDRDFRDLLRSVGGSRYARPVANPKRLPVRYVYICNGCGQDYRRKRKIDTSRFVCGRCGGILGVE